MIKNGNGTVWVWRVIRGIIVFVMTFSMATVGYAIRDVGIGSSNTARIEGIEVSLERIDSKLDRLLERGGG